MRARLSKWCATVGPVYVVATPRAVARQPIDRLAIVSWNIHEGRGDVDELVRRLRQGEFTDTEPVAHFVLLLQEAIRRDSRVPSSVPRGYPSPRRIEGPSGLPGDVVHRFADNGFAVLYAPSMRNGTNGEIAEDRGNAIVPELSSVATTRSAAARAAAACRHRLWCRGKSRSGRRWHLARRRASIRLLPCSRRSVRSAAAAGTVFVDALRSRDLNDAEGAAIVAGDFNAWRGSREPAVKLLREEFTDPIDSTDAPTWTGPLGLHARLDGIFMRGLMKRSRVARLPSRFGSDHYPLVTVVEF